LLSKIPCILQKLCYNAGMADEVMTLWVRLKGEEREQAEWMREVDKRSYASLIRKALAHYYEHLTSLSESA
jgi:hypothetical protein